MTPEIACTILCECVFFWGEGPQPSINSERGLRIKKKKVRRIAVKDVSSEELARETQAK